MINEKSLRKIAFIITIAGVAVLLMFLLAKPKEVSSFEDIKTTEINEKVLVKGKIESQRDFGNFKILEINGIEAICNCKESFLDKEVEIVGLVEEFNGKRQVRILRVEIID